MRQQRQCAFRLTPATRQNAVVTSIRPVVFKLNLELPVIGFFVNERHVDRQSRVIRFEFFPNIVRQYEVVLVGSPKSGVLSWSGKIMRLYEVSRVIKHRSDFPIKPGKQPGVEGFIGKMPHGLINRRVDEIDSGLFKRLEKAGGQADADTVVDPGAAVATDPDPYLFQGRVVDKTQQPLEFIG